MFPGVEQGQRLVAGVAMESFRGPSALYGLDFLFSQGYFLWSDALKSASQLQESEHLNSYRSETP